jgi:hypothetical protein
MPIWSEEPTLTLTNLMVGVEGYGGSMAAGLPTSSEVRYLSPPTHPLPQSAEDRFRTNRDRGHTLVTVIRPQVTDAASGALTHGANGKFQLYLRNDADFFGFDTVGSFGLSDDASASVFASEWALLIHSYQEGVGSEVRVRWLGNGKLVTRSASLTHTSPATASDTAFSLARDGASGITHGLYEFALHDRKMSASETDALLTKLTDSYFASSLASCAWRASREIDTLSVSYAVNATLTITKAVAWRAALFDFAQLDTEDPLAPSLLTMLTNNSQYATESASVGGGMESVSRHEVTLSRAFVSSGGAKEPLRKDRAYHLVLYGTDADGAVTVRDRKLLAHRAQTDPSALLASVDTAVVCTGLQANESVSVLPGTEVAADGVALPATLTDGLRALRLNGASDPVPIRESQNDPVTVVMVVRVNHDGYGAVTSSSAGDFDWRVTDAEIGLAGLGANVFSSGDAAAVDTTKAVYAVLLVSQQPSPTSTQVCYWLIDGNNAIAHASYQGAGSTTATALSIEPNHPLCELLISPVYMPKGSTEHQAIVTYVLNKYGGESIPTLQAPLVSLSNDVAKFDVSVFSTEADVSSWRAGVFQKDAVPTTAAEIYSVLGAASTIVGEALPSSAFVGGDASTIVNDDADGNGFTLSGGSGFMYAGVTLFESAALGQSYEWAVMMDNPTPDSNIRPIISFFSNSTGLVAVYLNIGIDANQNVEFGMALYSSIEDSTRVTVANQYNTYGENIDGFDYALDGRNLKIRDNADGDLLNASPSISDPLTKLNFKVTLVPHPSDPALLDIEFVCFRNDKKAEMIFNMPSIKHVHYGGYGTTEGDYKYVVQGEAWKMRQYAYQHDTMVSNFRDMTLISGDPSAPSPAVVSGDAVSRYTVENVSADLVKAVNADGSISSFGADGVAALAMLDARGEYTLRTRLVAFRSVPTEPPSDRWRLTWKDKIGTSAQRCGEIALYGDYFEPTQEHSPTTIASSSRAYLGDSRTVQDSSWNNTYAPWSADFTYAAPMTLHQVVIGSTDSGPNNSVGGFPSEYLNVEYLDDNGVWTLHSRLTFSEIVSGPGGTETESGSGLYPWNATTYPFTGHHGKDVFRWDGQKWYHHTAYGHAFDGTESGYLGNYPVTLNGVTYY